MGGSMFQAASHMLHKQYAILHGYSDMVSVQEIRVLLKLIQALTDNRMDMYTYQNSI